MSRPKSENSLAKQRPAPHNPARFSIFRCVMMLANRHLFLTAALAVSTVIHSVRAVTAAENAGPVVASAQSGAPDAVAAAAEPMVPENWAVHGQATTVWQFNPSFHAPYQGPQSLHAGANTRETFDTTLYLGVRPWPGAEIWVNPEIDQGFGLSNTLGVAGFPNGEAYKIGQRDPYLRVQRLFFRQTINLGGEVQKVDPAINQLGGSQTAGRIVVTMGKFSAGDIFDTNQYAHDPRNDFMNWSLIDMGAWDYAADAWGYTYGGAVEWYQDRWAIRAGLFDLSTVANSTDLDPVFVSQTQFNFELEERHEIWDRPGKVKMLFSLGRGNFGTYSSALALARRTGRIPDVAAAVNYRSKYGFGLNLEQQIGPDIGMFARASWTQDDVQAYDFTDIGASVSLGLSLKGTGWSRPHDTIGAAVAVNRIAGGAQAYLNAGGLGILIGDGRLPKAAVEQIFETYYSLAAFEFASVSFDYQFINNPAYNPQRGPVSVLGMRLHAEF